MIDKVARNLEQKEMEVSKPYKNKGLILRKL